MEGQLTSKEANVDTALSAIKWTPDSFIEVDPLLTNVFHEDKLKPKKIGDLLNDSFSS